MLYSLLVAVLILSFFMALIVPYCVIKAFLIGFNTTAREEGRPTVKVDLPKLPKRKPKAERSETDKMNKILSNIDTYDGTPIGQKEIY